MGGGGGREGHNSICSVFHQIRWDGKALSFLARETVLAFQSPLLPALRMGYSCCSEKLGQDHLQDKMLFLALALVSSLAMLH